jgi:putative endonuclease
MTTGRRYTGATSDLERRFLQHNTDQSTSTKNRGPWKLIYSAEFSTLGEALQRERFLKTGKGREELQRLLQAEAKPEEALLPLERSIL